MPSSFRDDVTGALPLPDPMTIPALLLDRAARRGDHTALRVDDVRVTYRELVDRAGAMAGSLARRGIRRGDPVAAMTTNRVEAIDLILGCAWLGAVAVPLNTAFRGDALRHVLAVSGARHVLVEPEYVSRVAGAGFRGELWIVGTERAPQPNSWPLPPVEGLSALSPRQCCSPPAPRGCRKAWSAPTHNSCGGDRVWALHSASVRTTCSTTAAAVPHQRHQRVLPGRGDGRHLRSRPALLGARVLAPRRRRRRDRRVSARRDGRHAGRSFAVPARSRASGDPGALSRDTRAAVAAVPGTVRCRADRRIRNHRDESGARDRSR